ncbi:orotidine-5'-phosphate decarboxylase [endosymbiont of unidentified scaly snail isolate Monju]|uniref:orotidine-5'-phosphate decarboxylase n=1 Tax=endosymbiont of unidentified scaly snail isolate Monju TaxID=1248727 RepID=UPI0003892510|nr:orotidine-5'-phosphate decarboxylase [endosymbiont of unidentified scaly snail isolate Monju]BAN69007.1 orotidine-5'-phosphate decarboxylase [endosymbiont of unidentified scaly snail isolate Monju]
MSEVFSPRVIVALDYPAEAPALALIDQLDPGICRLKIGKEMFTRLGPDFVRRVIDRGFEVFLDLKYHDIPNTVAAACEAAADLGVWMLNLHASGGRRMMETAMARLAQRHERPLLVAVTILTSLGADELAEIGFVGSPEENVQRLAGLAADCGLDGVVCSPREAATLRAQQGDDFLLVTPGVRPATASLDDQTRVMTPGDAIRAGSSHLVVGRPITAAADPLAALSAIAEEVAAAV